VELLSGHNRWPYTPPHQTSGNLVSTMATKEAPAEKRLHAPHGRTLTTSAATPNPASSPLQATRYVNAQQHHYPSLLFQKINPGWSSKGSGWTWGLSCVFRFVSYFSPLKHTIVVDLAPNFMEHIVYKMLTPKFRSFCVGQWLFLVWRVCCLPHPLTAFSFLQSAMFLNDYHFILRHLKSDLTPFVP
jgi:hypothetical protein